MHPLLFHFGHIAIPTYGVCTALALLGALAVAAQQARRNGLATDKVWNLGLLAILTTLFGVRLLLVLAHLETFREHPLWLLGVAAARSEWISLGAAALGACGAVLYALAEGLPLPRVLDVAAPGVALGFAINRIGAFCAGLAWGTPTRLPWGVKYRSVLAYFWYRTPLGVQVHPVQLYDAAASLGIFALLWKMPKRRDGEAAGVWLFLYGLCRFFVEMLRGDEARGLLTEAQVLAIAGVLLGGMLWLRREAEPEAAGETAA